jgi:hypothetical protein
MSTEELFHELVARSSKYQAEKMSIKKRYNKMSKWKRKIAK